MYYIAFCLLSMILLPTLYTSVRFGIIIFGFALILFNRNKFYVEKQLKSLWLSTLFVSTLFIIYGIMNNCPGALPLSRIYIIYPLMYFVLAGKYHSRRFIDVIDKVLLIGGLINTLLSIVVLLNVTMIYSGVIYTMADFFSFRFGTESGNVSYSSPLQDSSVVFFSYSLCKISLFNDLERKFSNYDYLGLVVLCICSAVVIFLSQQRALWLVAIAIPFLILFLRNYIDNTKTIFSAKLVLYISIIVLGIVYIASNFYDIGDLVDKFKSAGDFKYDDSNIERTLQFKSLMNDFHQSPLIGNGLGMTSQYKRSFESSWAYELSYILMLASVGIIGMVYFLYSVSQLFLRCMSFLKRNKEYASSLLPHMIATISILVTNATNPTLMKFDYIWIFYLPIISLNALYYDSGKIE